MKKGGTFLLLGLTIAFTCFIAGLLTGRAMQNKPVTIQTTTSPAPQVTSATNEEESTVPIEKVNINTASEQLLDTLPGIGPVLAKRIIAFREANGPFQEITDISLVDGIGPEKLLSLLDYITVED